MQRERSHSDSTTCGSLILNLLKLLEQPGTPQLKDIFPITFVWSLRLANLLLRIFGNVQNKVVDSKRNFHQAQNNLPLIHQEKEARKEYLRALKFEENFIK